MLKIKRVPAWQESEGRWLPRQRTRDGLCKIVIDLASWAQFRGGVFVVPSCGLFGQWGHTLLVLQINEKKLAVFNP